MRSYTSDELEQATGFDRRTIAYYVQEGLIPKVGRRGPRTRYPKLVRDRLLFIRRVREAEESGEVSPVSLSAMREIFERNCTHVRFDEQVPLFRNPDPRAASTMWGEDALYDTWKTATDKAGLPWVPPYRAMKHTQVSALRAAGIPVDDIVEQCRWASPQMMAHYDDAKDERRDAVVVKLDELAREALGVPEGLQAASKPDQD